MPRQVFEEQYKVHFLPACADISAPTQAEITAGTDLSTFVTKDGVQIGTSNQRVSVGDISTTFDGEIMGSWGANLAVSFFKDDTTDTAWTTLPRGTAGFLLIALFGSTAATEPAYVFPIECGQRELPTSAANERQSFTVPMAVTGAPDLDSVIAA